MTKPPVLFYMSRKKLKILFYAEGRQSVEKPMTIMMGRAETEYKCSNPVSFYQRRFIL